MTIRIPANRLLAVVLVLVMVFTGLLIAASRNVLVYPTPDAQSKFPESRHAEACDLPV
jgi:hypothetical protein